MKSHIVLRFRTTKNRFCERSDSIEEEMELRKVARKKVNTIERLETDLIEMEELEIQREFKLLVDLKFERGLEIDEIMETEIRLEKLKIPKTTINAIKKSIILLEKSVPNLVFLTCATLQILGKTQMVVFPISRFQCQ